MFRSAISSISDKAFGFLFRHQVRGANRLWSKFGVRSRIKVRTQHGIILQLSPVEYIDSIVIKTGYYEIEVLDSLLEILKDGDVFWDIGANLGLHGLTVAHQLPSVSVSCFEPNPEMCELLNRSVSDNGLKVNVLKIAISDTNQECDFFIHRGNLGMSGLHNWNNQEGLETTRVFARTAESLIADGATAPNVVKIDVEGHELQVLAGFESLMSSIPLRAIVFEDGKELNSQIKQFLVRHGFEIRALNRVSSLTSHNLENYVATRVIP